MSETVKYLCGTGLEMQSSCEEAVLDKRECRTNIWKRIRKHQGSPEIVNGLLNDSADNRTLVEEGELS